MSVAYSAGHYKNMIANIKERPYWMYNAVLDQNTRPSHRALHGKVYRADDPIWDKIYPPNDWNCRCSVIPLDDSDLEEMNLKVEEASRLPNSFKIGEGWDYNPGKAFLSFDDTFDGNFKINPNQPNYKDFGRPSVKDVKDRLEAPDKFPSIHKIGEEKFIELLKKEFELKNNPYSVIATADDDKSNFDLEHLKHFYEKRDGRERYAPYIKKTLQDPFEVYLTEYINEKNQIELRKTYIGLFKDKDTNEDIFISLRQSKDGFIFWNAFERRTPQIDKLRKGYIKYWKA
mgnify:CR=1 FL=1